MSRHYSARSFFRQIPNDLLARYFKVRGLFGELDFTAMKETRPEEWFWVWLQLPEEQRNALESEFREIFEMSCEKGVRTLLDEARSRWPDGSEELDAFIETLSSQPGHFHRGMAALLDHQECWRSAVRSYHPRGTACWRKRKHLGHRPAATDAASLEHLADLIRTYFHRREGRGNHCLVESFRRDGLDYFFAYPEDYSRQEIEWVDGALGLRPHHPAFEVVFVYSRREGSLDLSFPGPYRYVEPLQEMFATAILKLDRLPDEPANPQVYDLNPLLHRSFEFVYGADSGIEAVTVRKLQMSSRAVEGNRISVETESSDRPEALYDLLDSDGRSIPYKYYGVTQAEMVARMAAQGGELARTIRICLAGPASCSLDYGERELKLRAMLKASGLELRRTEPDRVKSPEAVLIDLGARVCASSSQTVRIAPRELDRWPSEAVTALKAQKILKKAGPARSTVCPGCERQCPMPVHGLVSSSGRPARGGATSEPFIVCDKRGDTHRVPVFMDRLAQWETSAERLGRFVADGLSLRWKGREAEGGRVLEIGIAGGKHRRMLRLRLMRELRLAAGSSELNFSSILRFRDGSYGLEESVVHRWLDAATEESPITATQVRYESRKLDTRKKSLLLQKAYRALKRERPGMSDVWYARQIARSDVGGGLSPDTIRKRMKK